MVSCFKYKKGKQNKLLYATFFFMSLLLLLQPDKTGTEHLAVVMLRESARLSLAKALERGPLTGRLAPLRCGGGPRCMPILPEEEELAQQVKQHYFSIVFRFFAGTKKN